MQTTYAQKNDNVARTNGNGVASVEDHSEQASSLQRKMDMINSAAQRMTSPIPVQRAENPPPRPNNTGLPDDLKNGVESLSGYSLDNVRVHYNSPKPATVQALAYTQGTDIHVAPGQEHTLPHEAWHVTQQMAGRVSPTTNINGMPVNDNESLEHEADVMGEKAVQSKNDSTSNPTLAKIPLNSTTKQCTKQDSITYLQKTLNAKLDQGAYVVDLDSNPDILIKLFLIWRETVNEFFKNISSDDTSEIIIKLKYTYDSQNFTTTYLISKSDLGYVIMHETPYRREMEKGKGNYINGSKTTKTFTSSHSKSSDWVNDSFTRTSGDAVSKLIAERGRFRCLETISSDNSTITLENHINEDGPIYLTPKDLWSNSDSGVGIYREHISIINKAALNVRNWNKQPNLDTELRKVAPQNFEIFPNDHVIWKKYQDKNKPKLNEEDLLPVKKGYPYENEEIVEMIVNYYKLVKKNVVGRNYHQKPEENAF